MNKYYGSLSRKSIKKNLLTLLPVELCNSTLSLWRKFYWWNRKRISPRRNRRIIKALVASRQPIQLELGSGKRVGMDDWVASDIGGSGDIQLDFTEPLPFPNNSVEIIYSSHVLEHFSYPHPMMDLLKECHRILQVGGAFSISVPNAKIFLDAYASPGGFNKQKYCSWDVGLKYQSPIDFVNFVAYLGGEHKHLFDEENLVLILQEAGFHSVRIRGFDPDLDLQARKHESIYAIGVK